MELEAFANGDLVSNPTEDVPACVGVRGYGHLCFKKRSGHGMENDEAETTRRENYDVGEGWQDACMAWLLVWGRLASPRYAPGSSCRLLRTVRDRIGS